MDRSSALAVIPARYGSTRLPGKPLLPLAGRPMVAHVVQRAREAGCFTAVIVATDHPDIAAAAEQAGACAVLTGEHRSGSDRVAAAIGGLQAAVIVNVQGDEPAVPPANLRLISEFLVANPAVPLATLCLPASREDLGNPNIVKVVCDLAGRALYFSRAAIPYPRHEVPGVVLRHVGLYGYQRHALMSFTSWPECDLERTEGLEQLRALAHGMPIHVLRAAGDSVSVDTPEDIPRAEAALAALAPEPAQHPGEKAKPRSVP